MVPLRIATFVRRYQRRVYGLAFQHGRRPGDGAGHRPGSIPAYLAPRPGFRPPARVGRDLGADDHSQPVRGHLTPAPGSSHRPGRPNVGQPDRQGPPAGQTAGSSDMRTRMAAALASLPPSKGPGPVRRVRLYRRGSQQGRVSPARHGQVKQEVYAASRKWPFTARR